MIYVYAVTDPVAEPFPQLAGMDDQPTEGLTADGIAFVFSTHPHRPFTATADHVCRHERVVETLMRDRTLLPARFGTTFRDAEELRAHVGSNAEGLRAGLDKVRGCVELGVRVLTNHFAAAHPPGPDAAPRSTSGRAWMLDRLDRERQTQRSRVADRSLALLLHNPLAGLARDARLRLHPGGFLLAAAYLVCRDRVDRFSATVRALASDRPQVRLLCTGPWPPYSFTPALADSERPHV